MLLCERVSRYGRNPQSAGVERKGEGDRETQTFSRRRKACLQFKINRHHTNTARQRTAAFPQLWDLQGHAQSQPLMSQTHTRERTLALRLLQKRSPPVIHQKSGAQNKGTKSPLIAVEEEDSASGSKDEPPRQPPTGWPHPGRMGKQPLPELMPING